MEYALNVPPPKEEAVVDKADNSPPRTCTATENPPSRFQTEINPWKPLRDRLTGLTRNTCGEHQDTQRNTATPPSEEIEKRLQPSEPSHPRREQKRERRGEKEESSDGRGRTGAEEAADHPTRSATRRESRREKGEPS
ncbi:LOW QUALITY PROTEIN: hypothetical protein HID58_028673 [Brassica napus]|uniref:Uncharacterized protein n=1 Tax=Brassica napus TaxID=3708 RepID=A0ABQ8CBW4_BRANA|nr:LOW QUALITY PROTEIN: hypothetical protein HID58_028673 [Brassica napus]